MSFVGKWFGFGRDLNFDDGVRAYEKRAIADAIARFRAAITGSRDQSIRERAKSYLAGCFGKLAVDAWQKRDFDQARRFLLEGVELRPGFADLWLKLGQIELILGELESAVDRMETALAINPEYANAQYWRGLAEYRLHKGQAGVEMMEHAVASDSRLATSEWKEGLAAHHKGDWESAYASFKEVRPAADDVQELTSEADALAKVGRWDDAETLYVMALVIAPSYADLRCRYGQALMERGEVDSATGQFLLAIEGNPNYAEAHALLGVAYRRMNEEEKALAAFRAALNLDRHHPIAEQEILYRRRGA